MLNKTHRQLFVVIFFSIFYSPVLGAGGRGKNIQNRTSSSYRQLCRNGIHGRNYHGCCVLFLSNVQRFINHRCEQYEDLPPRLHIPRYNSITRRDTFEHFRSLCTSESVAGLQSMAFRLLCFVFQLENRGYRVFICRESSVTLQMHHRVAILALKLNSARANTPL